LISGALFLIGALGFEMLGGRYYKLHESSTILIKVLYTIEELLEMLGIAIFIYALLSYLVNEFQSIEVSINNQNGT